MTVAEDLPEDTRRLQIFASIASDSGADSRTSNNRDRSITPVEFVVEPSDETEEEDSDTVEA